MAPLLQAESVSMSFGGVHALSGVSFTLQQGEILGLIGPNGAGKTTLFNCITGVVPGYRGSIRYDDRDLRSLKPHQRARLKIARSTRPVFDLLRFQTASTARRNTARVNR